MTTEVPDPEKRARLRRDQRRIHLSGDRVLADELRGVLNRYSRENVSNTPDFILAEFMLDALAAFERASTWREAWYGRELSIGSSLEPAHATE